MSTAPIISDLQKANPSAVIELFVLTTNVAQHGSAQTYRFHAGSSLNQNGEIVWQGNSYLRFPVEATGFAYQRGQIPRPTLTISNAFGFVSALLQNVNQHFNGNDLTGAVVQRKRTLARFLDAVNFPVETTTILPTKTSPKTILIGVPARLVFCVPEKLKDKRGSSGLEKSCDFGCGVIIPETPDNINPAPIKPRAAEP